MVERKRGGRSTAGRVAAGGKGGDSSSSDKRKGEKGAGKGKDDRKGAVKGNGKGKDNGKGKNTSQPQAPQERYVSGAKTVQELEAEMLHSKGAGGNTTKERREAAKQPLEATGRWCEVKKHSEMGCAVVTFADIASRDAVMNLAAQKGPVEEKGDEKRPLMKIGGVDVQLRPHKDKAAGGDEIKTDIFVAWGRQAEKTNMLGAPLIAEAMDILMCELRGEIYVPPEVQSSPMLSAQQQPAMNQMLQQSLAQMLPQPMVPGPQQQAEYMNLLWAAQAQVAQQQQLAATQQMQAAQTVPPASPQPSTQTQSLMETPPRSLNGGQMRKDAPDFTPPPVSQQQPFLDQYTVNELDQYADWNYNQTATPQPNKRFEIVNPSSGEKVTAPPITLSEGAVSFVAPGQVPAFPSRKPVKIFDPNTNTQVDTLGMIFEKPKPGKTFAIKDPTSGSLITA